MPLGFDDFAYYWNVGAQDHDHRQISRVYLPADASEYRVEETETPVHIRDFFITPEQVSLAIPTITPNSTPWADQPKDTLHNELARDYLMDSLQQRRANREAYGQRQENWARPYNQKPAYNQRAANDSGNISALSRLRFKRKRQCSPSPVRHAPTPSPSNAHGKAPKPLPRNTQTTNLPKNRQPTVTRCRPSIHPAPQKMILTISCLIHHPFILSSFKFLHSHFVILFQRLSSFLVLSPDSVHLAWWAYVTVHSLYSLFVQLLSQWSFIPLFPWSLVPSTLSDIRAYIIIHC